MKGCLVQSITASGPLGPVMLYGMLRTRGHLLSLRLEDLNKTGPVGGCIAGKFSIILIPEEFI